MSSSGQWPGAESATPLRHLSRLKQQMLGKFNVQFRVLGVDWSQLFSILIIQNLISAGCQAAQLDLSAPRFCLVRGVERVIHAAIFLDRVSLGHVVAVSI